MSRLLVHALLLACLASSALAQHAKVTSVAVDPNDPNRVWACNRDNASVAIVDVASGKLSALIPVGIWPRSIAFSADGSLAFVANQRGNVPVTKNFVTPFDGSEVRGTVSVIDTGSLALVQTLSDVGTEPYGVVVAPSGKYFAVSGFRSGTIKFYDAATLQLVHTHELLRTLNVLPAGKTIADADGNQDFLADQGEPRAFVITSDSKRLYVTHLIPGFVTALDVTLDASGLPSATSSAAKIDLRDYPFDIFFNPTQVQTLESQGNARFLDDIALSPDGTRALVPHLLHNVNHDVNFAFGPALKGNFANRVYPALSVIDTQNLSFASPGDLSARLHNELSDPLQPAELVPFGPQGEMTLFGGIVTLGASGSPTPGSSLTFTVEGAGASDITLLGIGPRLPAPLPLTLGGSLLINPLLIIPLPASHSTTLTVPGLAPGTEVPLQAVLLEPSLDLRLSNGLLVVANPQGFGTGKLGYRAGHPSRVLFNTAGDRALLLNRGSEDVFLYEVAGSALELVSVFPPRHGFVARQPLDTKSALGDLPLGMTLVDDFATPNDDALLFVANETTRTLSTLRVDFGAGVITQERSQIRTVFAGADVRSLSERIGEELFEDASRPQTAGNFNNSCASCHFEGGADGNVWQRSNGPRSTMQVYGGPLLTGLILWKGVRLNMGETGPMFGGENGGTGVFSDIEQQGLSDFHKVIPVPLNPNLDPLTGQYSTTAAFGKDLYFGTNDTGLNPTMRDAGCATCHPDKDTTGSAVRGYTADFLDPILTNGENLEFFNPNCLPLQENIAAINIRDVNTGVNVDADGNGMPDADRNLDGFNDVEAYTPMNADRDDDFTRDDPNGYMCPQDPDDPSSPLKVFTRDEKQFSIPTKLGVFSTGPYFHDHAAMSLRALLDPESQTNDPVFGNPSFPTLQKLFNGEHDVRGHQQFVPNVSKVQLTLQSSNVQQDIDAILDYIRSL